MIVEQFLTLCRAEQVNWDMSGTHKSKTINIYNLRRGMSLAISAISYSSTHFSTSHLLSTKGHFRKVHERIIDCAKKDDEANVTN